MENSKNLSFCDELNEFLENYISELNSINKSKNTLSSYSTTILSFINFIRENIKIINFKTIRTSDFTKFLEYKSATLNRQGEISPGSKALYIRQLKQFFSYIDSESEDSYDFEKIFERLKVGVPERDPKCLEDDEIDKILSYLDSQIELADNYCIAESRAKNPAKTMVENKFLAYRNSFVFKFYLYSGLRASELVGIKVSDLKVEEDEPEVWSLSIIGKGNKQAKVFILKAKIEKEKIFFERNKYKIIASTRQFNAMSRVQIWKMLTSTYKNSGVAKSSVHLLRHTFATNMYKELKDISTVKEMLRHKSIQTTTIYARENEKTTKNNYVKALTK